MCEIKAEIGYLGDLNFNLRINWSGLGRFGSYRLNLEERLVDLLVRFHAFNGFWEGGISLIEMWVRQVHWRIWKI